MKRFRRILLAAAFCFRANFDACGAHEISLAEALNMGERGSPRLKAALLHEQAAHKGAGVAQAGYYPSLAFDAADSWGFPGSSGYLGIGGLMGSPYRSGAAAGFVAQDTLFDFGRTYSSAKTAQAREKLAHDQIAIDKYSVDLDILQTFYECSRFRTEHEVWNGVHDEIELVAKEVARFVDTGQRSIVDRYLSQAQVEEARTNRNYFKSRMKSTVERLAMLMGASARDLECPALPALSEPVPLYPVDDVNPYVLKSQSEVELARYRVFGAKADYLPKIVGVASAGTMERVRLVNRADYSGGLGLIIPLFDGLGTVNRVGEAEIELEAKTQELGEVRLRMEEINAKYDEIIDASKARIEHLEHEQKLAQEGFRVAKNRYFKFQGTLVDLRDALRNLGRVETEIKDTQANLLEAGGAKALLNGSSTMKPARPDGPMP